MANPPTNPTPDAQTDGDDNPFAKLLAGFFKSGSSTAQQPQDPISMLIAIISAIISMVLGGKDNYRGDGDSPPEQRPADTQGQRDYDTRQQAEAKAKADAKAAFTPSKIRETAQDIYRDNQGPMSSSDVAVIPIEGGGIISSPFGHRIPPKLPDGTYGSSEHGGLDIAPRGGEARPHIIAPVDGTVAYAGPRNGYGNVVEVMGNRLDPKTGKPHTYLMAHLSQIDVKAGQKVKQFERVGIMGTEGKSNGVHLHFEERDASGKPINPEILGRHWAELERFSATTSVAYLEAHKGDTRLASNSPAPASHGPAPASHGNLGNLTALLTTPSANYVAPNAGKKPVVAQNGRTAS